MQVMLAMLPMLGKCGDMPGKQGVIRARACAQAMGKLG